MRIKSDLILRHIGNEHIIIDPSKEVVDMAKVYTLNETAAWLWKQLENKDFTIKKMVELLLLRYDVDRERATTDTRTLAENFENQGLLTDGHGIE